MADNVVLDAGSGGDTIAADDIGGVKYPLSKLGYGALDSFTIVTATAGLPVQPQTGATWAVTDNSGSLTVDAPVGTPVCVRLSDGSAAITTLPVSLATVPSHDVTNAGTFAVQAAQSGTWNVTNVSGTVSLPTGAATSAKQDTGNTSVASIDGKITACNTGAVVVSSSALPSGASTAARQDTGNTSLSSIDGKMTACNTGAVVVSSGTISTITNVVHVDDNSGSLTVDGTVAATQSGTWNVTNVSGTVSLPTGAATAANQSTANTSLSSIDGKLPALGQALAAASVPVVLTAAQLTTLTPLSTVAATQSGTWNVTNISGTVSLPTGAATAAKQPALGTAGTASSDVLTVQGIASMTALKVDGSAVTQPVSGTFWQATQPVSGTVTANIGTSGSLALDATLTGGTQQSKITDGTNVATVKAASTAAGATDKALVVAVSPNNSVAVTGTFWQATQPVSLASLPALAAGTNLVGQISASAETGTIYNGTTALTPKFAKIAASSSGDNTLVAAVTSKKIRVLAYNFIANGTVNAKFQSGAAGTDLTGLKYCVANSGICAPFSQAGWFETGSGVLLNLNLSGAIGVGGELVYVEI